MKDQVEANVPLALLTAYQVGGNAEWFVQPSHEKALSESLAWARDFQLPITVIGAGTNLLVSDEGIPGLVVHLRSWRGIETIDEGLLDVRAGESIAALSWLVARKGWAGLEWAVGVPGSVGGAVVMNAGAHGAQMADNLVSVEVLTETGERRTLTAEQLEFSYRHSVLQERPWIVLSARIQLETGKDPATLTQTLTTFNDYRHRTQPSGFPNCGSVFRNPKEGQRAGWLIEQCGLKGYRVGAAQVAEKHANFILNRGGATAKDILVLMERMRSQVYDRWGVSLEPEVRMLGHQILI
jgi:UDP-N-acetylmuramate dehydrogenase